MIDDVAIQRIINRYTDGCNRQDWTQVLATFAEDGVWEVQGRVFTGHDVIQAAMAGFLAQMAYFTQFASASVIEVDGDRASARTTIRECGKFADRDEALEVQGRYDDELVRTAAGWRFVRRRFTSFGAHRFALLPGPAL
ncbi:MAG: nuclear transport factor 2 family protein [Novosphingobium sp.]